MLCLLLLLLLGDVLAEKKPPHIVIIVADDMGWNDVSFHGSDQIPTPNIDALAFNGVTLMSHYVSAFCTPSRSALLTGKLPIHTGMQHLVILEAEPRGLPLKEKLLPQYLKDYADYSTHIVGKWHQGFHRREYTPTFRGFDSHFGYWQGLQDYWSHEVESSMPGENFRGFDMRRNLSLALDTKGQYSTDLFTREAVRLIERHGAVEPERPLFLYLAHLAPHSANDDDPLQAPDEEVAKFPHILDPQRRMYAGMMSRLDQGVGEVVQALRRSRMLHNTILVFMADNGAAPQGIHSNRGSNYPLRGIKGSAWEGAIRGAAAIWSPLIQKPRRVHQDLMYMADWLPTLLSAGGLLPAALPELRERNIDGRDMWASISGEVEEQHQQEERELLLNIDPLFNYSSIRRGDFKYVLGTVDNGEEWYGATGRPEQADLEGESPTYSAERVLASPAATAIAGVLTGMQASRLRAAPRDSMNSPDLRLLTAQELLELRAAATLRCTVPANETIACNPKQSACLFNIKEDPCEQRNLAAAKPDLLASLEQAVHFYNRTALEPNNVPNDPKANPALWKKVWVCWQDPDPQDTLREHREEDGPVDDNPDKVPPAPMSLTVVAVLLGLAVLGIFALVALRCSQSLSNHRRRHLKGGKSSGRHFQELPQTEVKSEERPSGKTLESFANELRNMPSVKDLARSIE